MLIEKMHNAKLQWKLSDNIRPVYVKTLNPAYFSITLEAVKKVIVSMSELLCRDRSALARHCWKPSFLLSN